VFLRGCKGYCKHIVCCQWCEWDSSIVKALGLKSKDPGLKSYSHGEL